MSEFGRFSDETGEQAASSAAPPPPFAPPSQPASSPFAPSPFTGPSFAASAYPPPPPRPGGGMLFELRPLSLGEILDRTFTLYRRRFWLYAGLASLAAAAQTLTKFAIFGMGMGIGAGAKAMKPDEAVAMMGRFGVLFFVATLIALIAHCFTVAATMSAVSALYVGEETSVAQSLKTVRRHWFRYILILLWQTWSAMWIPFVLVIPAMVLITVKRWGLEWVGGLLMVLVFAGFIYAPFAYIRNSLGIAAAVVEDLRVRAAMRRSKFLVAGHKARVLGILLLAGVLAMVGAVMQQLFDLPVAFTHGAAKVALEALALTATFTLTALVLPVGSIALSLFYIDERVRKEGYDVELLMRQAGVPAAGVAEARLESLPSPYRTELA